MSTVIAPAIVRVEVTGNSRSGVASKTQKPYCMYEGYVHLPNSPYPDKASFYAEAVAQVPRPGMYECDVVYSVKDGRFVAEIDPRQGRTVGMPSTAKSPI
jgi:hypothetical protein